MSLSIRRAAETSLRADLEQSALDSIIAASFGGFIGKIGRRCFDATRFEPTCGRVPFCFRCSSSTADRLGNKNVRLYARARQWEPESISSCPQLSSCSMCSNLSARADAESARHAHSPELLGLWFGRPNNATSPRVISSD